MDLDQRIDSVQERLQVTFKDRKLLLQAITSPTYANEHPEHTSGTNTKISTFGNELIRMLAYEHGLITHPTDDNGILCMRRDQMAHVLSVALASDKLHLKEFLLLGKKEDAQRGTLNAFRALVAVIYLDQGLEACRVFVKRTLAAD